MIFSLSSLEKRLFENVDVNSTILYGLTFRSQLHVARFCRPSGIAGATNVSIQHEDKSVIDSATFARLYLGLLAFCQRAREHSLLLGGPLELLVQQVPLLPRLLDLAPEQMHLVLQNGGLDKRQGQIGTYLEKLLRDRF